MTETVTPSQEEAAPTPAGPIVGTAGRYYRNARYIMTAGLVIMGAYFAYDGYVGYPKKNRQIAEIAAMIDQTKQGSEDWIKLDQLRTKLGTPESDTSIGTQIFLGYALPVGAIAYLVYFLRKSRGKIRLDGDVLSVPGHPPVPLSAITAIDDSLWKKKGIAKLSYDTNGQKGVIILDDFVYQQTPTDAIYDRVLAARNG
ncbi:MAG: hypothetical protein QM754_07460 [Tepidisphaeraceae bacterium]